MECRHRIGIQCKYIKFAVEWHFQTSHYARLYIYLTKCFTDTRFYSLIKKLCQLLVPKNCQPRKITPYHRIEIKCKYIKFAVEWHSQTLHMHIINNKFWNIQTFIYGLLSPKERIGDWNLQVHRFYSSNSRKHISISFWWIMNRTRVIFF